jgi:hypothetical protein
LVEPFFCAFGIQVLKKCFFEKVKKYIKNAEFQSGFKSVENVFKKCTKKGKSQTSLTNRSKNEKSAYFCHIFAKNNFLCAFFKNIFNGFIISVNSAFLYPY